MRTSAANSAQNNTCTRRGMLAATGLGLTGWSLCHVPPSLAEKPPAHQFSHSGTKTSGSVLVPGEPSSVGISAERLRRISERLQNETTSGQVTSASVLVARHGTIVLHQGFGKLQPREDAPSTQADTIYLLASITKPITCSCLMLLVERGLVALTAPVSRYLPEFRGDDRKDVRVWQLLSHVSGLPDMLPENTELRRAHAPLSTFVSQAMRTTLLFKPGSQFSYQSMGTLLAGEIVERVSRMRLRDFMQKELFEPLGMQNSVLGLTQGKRTLKIEETAAVQVLRETDDTRSWGANTPYWRDMGHPWGGLHSTTGDLAILLQCILNGGQYGQKRVFAPATAAAMVRDRNQHLKAPFGLGWALNDSLAASYFGDLGSSRTFGHVGATGTVAWADPERQLICVLLTTHGAECQAGMLLDVVSNLAQAAVT